MAKRIQNYRPFQTGKGGHFLTLYDDMLYSKAWSELTPSEIVLYIELLKKFQVKYVKNTLEKTNENDISFVKKEYLRLMHQTTFFKSIDHLIDLGFVRVVESGFATRECNIYGLNNMWQNYGTNKFHIKNEWKRVKNREY